MNNEQVTGTIRHVSQLLGGILVTFGVLNQEDLAGLTEALIIGSGAVFSIVAIVASWRSKRAPK